jgi:hypothetical protein
MEYITPQVEAMKIIFSNPAIKNKLSRKFKRQIWLSFDSQYIMVWDRLGEKNRMQNAILKFLIRYPFDKKNKSRVVTLLYSLPFGNLIQRMVQQVKKPFLI